MDKEMIIVQTLVLDSQVDPISNTLGFVSPEFNWMSWCLSCLQLLKYYKEVHLYTNEQGRSVLIDQLHLPYTEVFLIEPEIQVPAGLWAYYKIHTYSLQRRPFIHVDGDVYIWDKIKSLAGNSALIVQNIEHADHYYRKIYLHLRQQGLTLPDVIKQEIGQENYHAINAGIIGGCDFAFFGQYAAVALEWINSNVGKIQLIDSSSFNMAFEQHLFYCLAKTNKKKVTTQLDEIITDMSYKGFANFPGMSGINNYLHLVNTYKSNLKSCLLLARQLRAEHPHFYYRVIRCCQHALIPLKLSIYDKEIVSGPSWEVSSNLTDPSSVYWIYQYQQQKLQEQQFNRVFANPYIPHQTCFQFNPSVEVKLKDEQHGVTSQYFRIPNSLIKDYDELITDEIDQVLVASMTSPKTILQLYKDLLPYFDDEDIVNNSDALSDLIALKLKNGCVSNIYLIS